MDDVRENDQCLFFVGVTIILMAESKKELESVCETVETIGKRNSCTSIDTHYKAEKTQHGTSDWSKTSGNNAYPIYSSRLRCLCRSMQGN